MARTNPENEAFRDLPRGSYQDQHLYVIEFSNGVVKVGRSYRVRTRVGQHQSAAIKDGHRITRFAVTPVIDACSGEAELVARLERIGSVVRGRREYFAGLKFGAALTLARQCAGREYITAWRA